MKVKVTIISIVLFLVATAMQAQITIGGNVYGGGNAGNTGGSTKVTVYAGDLNEVYGGARQANVAGNAFVHIDGEHASDNIFINKVFGGNDIAGTIGTSENLPLKNETSDGLTEVGTGAGQNNIDNTWNAFIRTSPTPDVENRKSLVIGTLFGAGNGDYDYTSNDSPYKDMLKPELSKTYLEILGGCIAHLYGGGNNATVTANTTICIDNESPVLTQTNVWPATPTPENLAALARKVELSTFQSNLTSYDFNFARVFGGNNKAEMKIRPIWNLKNGIIRDLYSGGNQGAMTSPEGLLLNIERTSAVVVENLYGGCRMADVCPKVNGVYTETTNSFEGYSFPLGFAARVVIRGGDVNNVYGGNDISGKVYGGNAVGISASIRGDIYGGGNGSYAYTDNPTLGAQELFRDFYYDPGSNSVEALNATRPNAEQVSIHVEGSAAKPTIIHGGIFCGGNCATIMSRFERPKVELKIGSYVIADSVFLGNNGANMVKKGILEYYAGSVDATGQVVAEGGTDYSSLNLTQKATFDSYMDGAAMRLMPSVVFDKISNGDGRDYIDYTSYFGSFFCGGNVGSMKVPGKTTINFDKPIYIFNKVVGGCNNANIYQTDLNAEYLGGLLGEPVVPEGSPEGTIGDKLELNFAGLKILPMRWNAAGTALEWNTISAKTGKEVAPVTEYAAFDAETDLDRRLKGGNVYGGCYNSGHVNGNVIINIDSTLVERNKIFDVASDEGETLYENVERGTYTITKRNSGVILSQQGMDVLGEALNVFGGGYGGDAEIWGSTTINLNRGYCFQIFGGGEKGAIGQAYDHEEDPQNPSAHILHYNNDERYSTYINLNGEASLPGVARGAAGDSPEMAECEFIYGGGFEGKIAGSTHINLGHGRIFNSFAGSCNADILGHTETYIGRKKNADGTYEDGAAFPWIRDHIYGGNDLGGSILGKVDFSGRIRDEVKDLVNPAYKTLVENASAYIEYTRGRVRNILGGCFGDYEYTKSAEGDIVYEGHPVANKPYLQNAFVNFRPNESSRNSVEKVFGAGEGAPGDRDGDKGQDYSYVLVDIPDNVGNFSKTEVFGAGAYNGLGMIYTADETYANAFDLNKASAIIDLMRGKVGAAYGGSYEEGVTRRTLVNVPVGSTIKIGSIFGGAYGSDPYKPCDVYEANVNYLTQSENAYLICDSTDTSQLMKGIIFGGNNYARRTLYSKINISAPVRQDHIKYGMTTGTIYGAGCGPLTWNEYTEINLNSGAKVWEVYGGGEAGSVMSAESVQEYILNHRPSSLSLDKWYAAWTLGSGYDPGSLSAGYTANSYTNLYNPLVTPADMDDRTTKTNRYNTNVLIKRGAYVGNYAYGGGLGKEGQSFEGSGDVYGTTYIALLGGKVEKDIYAAGTSGSVYNLFKAPNLTASANAYIAGGTVRNVYGGGWKGSVGLHAGDLTTSYADDVLAETHVVIGKTDGMNFYNGIPAIERNAYGGGEGGAVYGTAYVKMMNGYVGYRYFDTTGKYEEKINDETAKDGIGANKLYESGCIFGGGYIDNSSVDNTDIQMYGGRVRNSIFGGGEIAAVGRGVVATSGATPTISKAGKTNVTLYEGYVERNVFGGGRGYNNLNEIGKLHCDGFVFGQTEVNIFGGEIGTTAGMASGYGNVFGGGDIGYVYGAYQYDNNGVEALGLAKKSGTRYDDGDEGYYYKYENGAFKKDGSEKILTEDCKVLIEPRPRVTTGTYINGHYYEVGNYVLTKDLNALKDKNSDVAKWGCIDPAGIVIHNAVFAGGNTVVGSTLTSAHANTPSVFGNATASVNDVYHRDLITLGTGYSGGLYGDGNLTLVDGYRELNITNYGTDYYTIAKEITIGDYEDLPDREAAYYELKYTCKKDCKDKDNNNYYAKSEAHPKASTITSDDLMAQFLIIQGEGANKTYVSVKDGENGPAILVYNETTKTWEPNPNSNDPYWEKSGVLPVYAGRLMNSIQRADFCGVFGSRMVLQGAQDRVPEIVDFTNYTINRVREVSLNQQHSVIDDDLTLKAGKARAAKVEDQEPDDYVNLDKAIHGNYFGIYNVVNYLGALTSDVHFNKPTADGSPDKRRTDNTNADLYGPEIQRDKDGNIIYESDGVTPKLKGDDLTYYQWKSKHIKDRTRNNGSSFNKVALASGVYLELTSEKSTGKDLYEKDWGYITGVIELDLINVQAGLGGGFVYAKNEHRLASLSGKKQTTLTDLNQGAVTRKWFDYKDETGARVEWETSGNFVHSTQTIIDDCYNISNRYLGNYLNPDGSDGVPAHYWYIKGSVYVYDQYISAYTGAPNAYSETVEIPLTIAAAAHGSMKLLDVRPNLYAYYSSLGNPLNDEQKLTFGDATYYKNDPISYWDWYMLSKSERELFVSDTYVVKDSCKINNKFYAPGEVLLPNEYNGLYTIANTNKQVIETGGTAVPAVLKATVGADGNPVVVQNNNVDVYIAFDDAFRSSNNMSHDTGYMLTYRVNNPSKWDTWYTEKIDSVHDSSKAREKNLIGGDGYEDGPTYHLKSGTGAVLGQKQYKLGELISHDVDSIYKAMGTHKPTTNQATFEAAYLVTKTITSGSAVLNPGFAMSATEAANYTGSVEPAYIVTKTIQMGDNDFVTLNTKMTESERAALITRAGDNEALVQEIQKNIQPAYYCTSSVTETNQNLYGGRYYESGINYRGLEAWSSMSEADRNQFIFNYDAFDLLIDKNYSGAQGQKYQYDGATYDSTNDIINPFTTETQAMTNPAGYSLINPVDYTATYNETSLILPTGTTVTVKHSNGTSASVSTIVQGDELVREEYEKLPNEQRHYSGIIVKDGTLVNGNYNVYVVNTSFQYGSTPYAVGTVISAEAYNSLSSDEKAYVTTLTFGAGDIGKTYYYCREEYEMGVTVSDFPRAESTPVAGTSIKGAAGGTEVKDGKTYVKVGTVIASGTETGQYGSLPNMQTNFTIHGISPTETSTLYVSRESDIYNLSKDKIITVIYQYDYEESDTHGNITPVSERHVVNIHVKFESGVPNVEDIQAPQIVLPGSKVGLSDPYVTPGAYELTGSGWELFQSVQDAESHINGVEYTPATDLLYYYQDGYYVAYYAKTYLGKTYSNHVPVSVANYHDLKKVMDATTHHYYIDHYNVHKEGVTVPKIYINDYSESGENGLDKLKDLFDLSLVTASGGGYTVDNGKITAATGSANSHLVDHALLNTSRVGASKNLEFFMRTDIDHSETWTPIGDDTHCFEGTLHGDGYTISGLDNSLFYKLCGAIYNLGVTGTFTGAGIAEKGSGYVENTWISTSSTNAKTTKPVFGDPSRTSEQQAKYGKIQIVNSYYQEEDDATNKYTNHSSSDGYGVATRKDAQAFYNGEVAYDLNGFYLNKRFYDNNRPSTKAYPYNYKKSENGILSNEISTGYYPASPDAKYGDIGYVEDRYADGDFIYAGGEIPTEDDERFYMPSSQTGSATTGYYYPIWPDDYLFFGQRLHYGYGEGLAHQDHPAHINKNDGRLSMAETSVNRVYRAPAYFRSSEMKVAHYNPYAVFAAMSSDERHTAYPDMTAIDFTGGNGDLSGGYVQGLADDKFYPPLLDNDGLTSFHNIDLTQNLLAYTPSASEKTADAMTYTAVTEGLPDPVYRESNSTYRTVDIQDVSDIQGHVVVKSESGYTTENDHFLVDKNDFNAPIEYTMGKNKRMWYQRTPDDGEFVDRKKGWDAISLPFSAELVTTHQKGEITHFYDGSAESANKTNTKIGHEYWLRQYSGIGDPEGGVIKADMIYPTVPSGYPTGIVGEMMNKTVKNDFLWNHYYKVASHMDRNQDFYQTYYRDYRYYTDEKIYKLLTRATPYIIGFPGVTYYEFDLSGEFIAQNTNLYPSNPAKLDKQTITFASRPTTDDYVTTIHVSDEEKAGVTHNGYTFYPSYLNEKFEAGTKYYTLHSNYDSNSDGVADCSSYRMVPTTGDATPQAAFRPYFRFGVSGTRGGSRGDGSGAEYIIFDDDDSEIKKEQPIQEDDSFEDLIVNGGRKVIVVKSSLREESEVKIVNMAGITLATFPIQPGETVNTNITISGAYIVRTTDGRYMKKVLVY